MFNVYVMCINSCKLTQLNQMICLEVSVVCFNGGGEDKGREMIGGVIISLLVTKFSVTVPSIHRPNEFML